MSIKFLLLCSLTSCMASVQSDSREREEKDYRNFISKIAADEFSGASPSLQGGRCNNSLSSKGILRNWFGTWEWK